MPAITVDDILVLPRVPEPGLAETERKVTSVTTAPSGYEGEGFPVRRAFAGVDLPRLDPFVHMDQMGEVDYGPGEPKGTPWHPHRGFETVTYIIDGTFQHQDSNGGGGLITDGDTQWMTAGGGILHIEAPPEELVVSGGLFHGFQLWVNLPARLKMTPPRYQDIRAGQVALLSSADGGALLRVIAGSFGGHDGPGSRTRRSRWCTRPCRRARRSGCRGGRTSTRSPTCWRERAPWAPRSGRSGWGSWPCSGPGTRSRSRPGPRATWTSCCSAASRSASRSRRTGRSS